MKIHLLSLALACLLSPSLRAEELSFELPEISGNVFGQDDRQELRDTTKHWGTMGRLDAGGSMCTATLVGPDLIVTAAHCVIDPATKKLHGGTFNFYSSLIDSRYKLTSTVTYVWWGTTDPETNRGHDWAILRLKQPLGKQLGWMGVKNLDLVGRFYQRNILLVGYSGDLKGGASAHWVNGCSFTNWDYYRGYALHDCDMARGASGGPMLWTDSSGQPWIVAINVAEYRNGGDVTLKGIPYSDERANIAVPSSIFLSKLRELRGL